MIEDKIYDSPPDILISEYAGETIVNSIKSSFQKVYDNLKLVLLNSKKMLVDIKNCKTVSNITNVLSTIVRETPLIGRLYKNKISETLDQKVERINSVSSFNDCIVIAYGVIDSIAEYIYKSFLVFSFLVQPSSIYYYIFENENKFKNYILNSNNASVYRQSYKLMVDAGISCKYASSFVIMLATLSPFQTLLVLFSGSKDLKNSVADTDFYNNPINYIGPTDSKTGFTRFEHNILKSVINLVKRYEECENDFEKDFILSKEMIKRTLILFGSSILIFVPIFTKINNSDGSINSLKFFMHVIEIIYIAFSFLILLINLVYAHIGINGIGGSNSKETKNAKIV